MQISLPTSGLDQPCAVPNFTGIPVVIAQPAYSVYKEKLGRKYKLYLPKSDYNTGYFYMPQIDYKLERK